MEGPASILYTAGQIRDRVRDLGGAITRDYAGRQPVLISVLKGGAMFHADLLRAVDLEASVDFMSISSYGAGSSGVVRIVKDLDQDILGQDVILVEDIVDTGLTLTYLLGTLRGREPASLEVCALLDKSARRITPIDIRYRGFDCPDRFVLGYGLDHGERYRNLPFIVTVEDVGTLEEDPLALEPLLGKAGERYR
ncbi:MAG TPA: hypoxanthine phosphoribosyltransferase [Actinomycetota bacterium]|nr:hypoxanthine phosphoribosyltransferase [Actinomycetota bacterium]